MLVLLVTASASAGTAMAARAARRVAAEAGGARLQPHESVRVRVVSGTRTSTRRVRVSRGGRFTVTFQGFAFPSCGADGYGGLYALLETPSGRDMKVA